MPQVLSIYVDESGLHPVRDVEAFYPMILNVLLQCVSQRPTASVLDKILVWTDRIDFKRKRKAVEKAVKLHLANELKTLVPYQLYHHSSSSEPWLQVADYCGWAIYKKWTDGEVRPYSEIRRCVLSEFDILASEAAAY